jgi:hypothetical protein
MKTKVIIFCGVVLAICVWLLLRRVPEQPRTESPEVQAPLTNQPAVKKAQPAVSVTQAALVPKTGMELYAQMRSNLLSPERKARLEQFQEAWRTPIEFYGKVVDENTNPVSGVHVDFDCNDLSSNGTSYYHTESDANGLFSIRDITGKFLGVHVSKEGYYSSKGDNDSFYYAGENVNFVPDPSNPVIFHLRKKGAGEKLIEVKQNYRVARDGTPLGIDLTTGKASAGGSGDLVVQCWTEDAGKSSGQKYDWHCLVTVPGGGLVLSDEEFAFLAPEEGYVPSAEIKMPADRPDWRNDVDLRFFYRLADGRYGRMTFSMIAGGDHFCMIDSVLNPTGSRNLEPSN